MCREHNIFPLEICKSSSKITTFMKYSQFHRRIQRSKSGWEYVGAEGSHYIYEKDGRRYPVPYHGSKEIGEGLRKKIAKDMGLE